jgi:hypothetical protein
METEVLKVQDLVFELIFPIDEEALPSLEIENNTSAVFVKVDITQALALRDMLTRFIEASHA